MKSIITGYYYRNLSGLFDGMNKETIMDGEGNGVQYSKEDLYQKSKLKQGIARSNSVIIIIK